MKRAPRVKPTADEEQLLFHRWLPWDASVAAERARLEYRPDLRPERESMLAADGRLWAWGRTIGEHLEAIAAREVDRLGLPALFVRYWIACFLSDYDGDHLHGIVAYTAVGIGVDGRRERVYPPSRQTLSVSVHSDGPDAVPVLAIQGPVALVTRDSLLDAVKRALALAPASRWPRHPILSRRKTAAGALVRGRPDERHKVAAKMRADGVSYGKIADALAAMHPELAEWDVTGRTVSRWLAP